MRSLSDDVEFWRRVDVGDVRDCWRWTGTMQNSYGTFASNGEQVGAHRYSWSFAYGAIPQHALVLHSCDRPWCVNPRHLRLGTADENGLDRSVLSRVRACLDSAERAERDRQAALDAVRAAVIPPELPSNLSSTMRRLRQQMGLTQAQFAAILGVSAPTVCGWEKGAHGMTIARMTSVAKALGVEIAELFA